MNNVEYTRFVDQKKKSRFVLKIQIYGSKPIKKRLGTRTDPIGSVCCYAAIKGFLLVLSEEAQAKVP